MSSATSTTIFGTTAQHDLSEKVKSVLESSQSQGSLTKWPDEILNPPGLVGEISSWIVDTAGIPRPKFALAAALTTCGALIGRGVKDSTGQRTNLYTLSVAPSSGGKDHPMKSVTRLLKSVCRERLLFSQATSDSALEYLLADLPVRLLLEDEVGDYLGNLKSAGANNAHLKTVIPCLKKLWSCGNSTYLGKTRAAGSNGRWRPPVQIVEPCLSVYGTGAPSRLFSSLDLHDFDDGTISRFLTFIEEGSVMRRDREEAEVSDALKTKIATALGELGWGVPAGGSWGSLNAEDLPAARRVDSDDEARQVFKDFEAFKFAKIEKAEDDPILYLWGKSVENARRVALIVAAFRRPESPMIEKIDAQYAVDLVTLLVEEMVYHSRKNVSESKWAGDLRYIEDKILRAGPEGITLSELTRKVQPKMDINEERRVLVSLVESETIVSKEVPGTGLKPVRMFIHRDYVRQ